MENKTQELIQDCIDVFDMAEDDSERALAGAPAVRCPRNDPAFQPDAGGKKMISFTDSLQLEREFYEWAEKNHTSTDPFTVITWLLEAKGAIPGNRIRTIKSRREVENEILERVPREYFENDVLGAMIPELEKVAVIKEVPAINPDCTAFACRLKVVLPEDRI